MNNKAMAGASAALTMMLTLAPTPGQAAPEEYDCMIEPAQTVEVRSPVVGLLQQVHAGRGERIRRGQVLVTIESSVEQSAAETAKYKAQAQGTVELARSKVAAAEEKARRMTQLSEEEFVSAQASDDAVAELKLAQAELKTALENAQLAKLEHQQTVDELNRRVLRSPFDGVVTDQYLYPGALVDAGEGKKPILKIAQTRPLAVQAILPFRLFPEVRKGARVVVLPEPPFSREIAATISTVDGVVNSAAGTFGVVSYLPNRDDELPGGIRCKLRLQPSGSPPRVAEDHHRGVGR